MLQSHFGLHQVLQSVFGLHQSFPQTMNCILDLPHFSHQPEKDDGERSENILYAK